MQTRRDFLKLAALLTGAAGTSAFLPEAIERAYAIEPASGSTWLDAEHIVILMQENRSFDHALGTLQGVRGFNDPRAIRLPNGNSVFVQTDNAGNSYAPWRLDIRDTRVTWMGSVPHSRNSQVDAWNDGRHDAWIEAKRSHVEGYGDIPLTMGHYTREDLPFYYSLADAFTVCDQHYCSVMTSTTPNRSVFWTGTVRDRQSPDSRVYMRNDQYERGGLQWKTFPERLTQAGIGWKFYQNDLTHTGEMTDEEVAWLGNFGTNVLENFSAYNVNAYPGAVSAYKKRIASATHQAEELEKKLAAEKDPEAAAKLRAHLEQTHHRIETLNAALAVSGESHYQQLSEAELALHHAAFVTNSGDSNYHSIEPLAYEDDGKSLQMMVPKGDLLHQFRKDVEEGKLPTVSWLSSPEKFSDHPTSPWYGAWYVSEVMNILTKNPEVWKKTIFILTYDENDGYFDHAPSYVAPAPGRPETGRASEGIDTTLEYTFAQDEIDQGVDPHEARSGPIGMGFRVPMIVASPWTRGGWVNSQLLDHTSTLNFLEVFVDKKYGKQIKEEQISDWRRVISGNLTSLFRPYDPAEKGLDYLNRDRFVVGIEKARFKEVPSNYKKLSSADIEEINRNPAASAQTTHQEPGTRRANALPYELYADGLFSEDGSKLTLRMAAGNQVHGTQSAGAPFNVYQHGKLLSATYAVRAGDALIDEITLPSGEYRVEIHAPNGFYRAYSGSEPHPVQVSTTYEKKSAHLTGNLEIQLKNTSSKPAAVTISDNAYKAAPAHKTIHPGREERVILHLKDHGWYDFSVKTEGAAAETRYAGRVETGKPSYTDPFMGGTV